MAGMRILVTGAAGFIGSHVVDRLVGAGHEVAAVDDLSSGRESNLADAQAVKLDGAPAVELHVLDVTTPELVTLARGWRPDVVVHLAAQISVGGSVADPVRDATVNVLGTVNALEAARAAGVQKFVYTSSAAVYGPPASLPVTRAAPLRPMSPYGASKACGETYLSAYRALHGLDFTTIVPANVYGPRQRADGEAGVVAIFTDALLRGEPTHVSGSGSQTRDYVYVGDVADAFVRACGPQGSGGRFNICTGVPTSDLELHALVAGAAGNPVEPDRAPARPGDIPAMVGDPGEAAAGLGWTPGTSIAEGIAATVDWMRRGLDARPDGRMVTQSSTHTRPSTPAR
jgi:UDP-glucose 4-epimerase